MLVSIVAAALVAYFTPPRVTGFAFPDNAIWKHRQNTALLAKQAAQEGYEGIELDLMFHEGRMRVAHDVGELPQSQTLEAYLADLRTSGTKLHLWFDIKTMTSEFQPLIRSELLELGERFDLFDRLLVESPRPTNMFSLCQKPITCSVWMQRTGNPLARLQIRMTLNALSRWGRVAMVSIDHRSTGDAVGLIPEDFPRAYYTYKQKPLADAARAVGGAHIYLTE